MKMNMAQKLSNDIQTLKNDASRTINDISKIVASVSGETKETSEKLLHEAYEELRKDFSMMQDKFASLSVEAKETMKKADEHIHRNPYMYVAAGLVGAFFLGRRFK